MTGLIRQRRRKMINFIPDDVGQRVRGRIRVEPEDLNGAFDGDRVLATVSTLQRERWKSRDDFAARAVADHRPAAPRFRESWVESMDEKFPFDIEIEGKSDLGLADGWVVLVEITSYPVARRNRRG